MKLSLLATIGALVALSGCVALQTRAERSFKHIEATIFAFDASKHRFPRDLAELKEFAAPSKPLDVEPFSELTLTTKGGNAFLVCKAKPPAKFERAVGFTSRTVTTY
ncbi:MAG: hypothetical protein WAO00_03605 [Chthoniobacterales bacterium]